MSIILFANNANTTLASPINAAATTISVAPGTGALFPNPGANQYFVATFNDAGAGLVNEIIHVTARSADTMTVVRAQEGTAAQSWNAGDTLTNYFTAGAAGALLQQGQYQQQSANYSAVDIGSTNAIIAILDPAPTSLSGLVGAPVRVKIAHTTTSGVVTLQCNGLSAPFVKSQALANLPVGTLTVGMIAEFIYDGTQFQFTGDIPSSGVSGVTSVTAGSGLTGGTITSSGTIAINPASTAQVQAGSDNTQAITAAALRGAMAAFQGTSGYQKLPNGTIIQWGRLTGSAGSGQVVTFPIPFPNDATISSNVGYSGSGDPWLINTSLNGSAPFTGFTVYSWKVGSGGPVVTTGAGIGWVAIGF